MNGLTFQQARLIVLGFGTALIAGVAASALLRGADLVEVLAIGLFLPILLGLAYGHVRGGLGSAVLVSGVYLVTRFATLGELDAGDFTGAAVVRVLLYLGLGLFGGWANDLLEQSLIKLSLYDEIDDDTGVGNARALVGALSRELARARRYESVFSLCVLKIPRESFDDVTERVYRRALRQLYTRVEGNVRASDVVSRVVFHDSDDLVVLLPETAHEGAEIFAERLADESADQLAGFGADMSGGPLAFELFTMPGAEGPADRYLQAVRATMDEQTLAMASAPAT